MIQKLGVLQRGVAESLIGEENVNELAPVMGGEDFCFLHSENKWVFVVLGVNNPIRGLYIQCTYSSIQG